MKILDGYIDGNTVLVNQSLHGYDGMKVMVTIMDEIIEKKSCGQGSVSMMENQEMFDEIFGLWADHDKEMSVEDTVRQMRKGRSFDY